MEPISKQKKVIENALKRKKCTKFLSCKTVSVGLQNTEIFEVNLPVIDIVVGTKSNKTFELS